MIDLKSLNKAIARIKQALKYKTKDETLSSSTLLQKVVKGARAIKKVIPSMRNDLNSKVLRYLKKYPELVDENPGIRDIFGLLTIEEEYTRCLGWILSCQYNTIFGRRLLTRIVNLTYPKGFKQRNSPDTISKDYSVICEYWAEKDRFDIYIRSTDKRDFLIIIENKILEATMEGVEVQAHSEKDEAKWQLPRYEKWANKQDCRKKYLIFLCQDPRQMRSKNSAFKIITWADLLIEVKRLRKEIKNIPPITATIVDLFIRDVGRFISPLSGYEDILMNIKKQSRISDIPIHIYQEMIELIEKQEEIYERDY